MRDDSVSRALPRRNCFTKPLVSSFLVLFMTLGSVTRAQNINLGFAIGFIGNFSEARGLGVTSDSSGNVYTTGFFGTNFDFDPGEGVEILPGDQNNNAFVSKLNASGQFVWAREIASPTSEWGHGIAVDNLGNVYVVGSFRGTLVFGAGGPVEQALSPSGFSDVFVCKYDEDGNFMWAKDLIGSDGSVEDGIAISLDGDGNIYITGRYQGAGVFDPDVSATAIPTDGSLDIFVAKLSTNGDFMWAKGIGGNSLDGGTAIVVAETGVVYLTGFYTGNVDFNPGASPMMLTDNGFTNIFVLALDTNSNFVWAKQMGGDKEDRGLGIAVDSDGNVHTTGFFQVEGNFDPDLGPAGLLTVDCTGAYVNNSDVFVSKLTSAGVFVWAKRFGACPDEHGMAIAVDGMGNVSTTGFFQSIVDFDPDPNETFNLAANDSRDIFVNNLDVNGNLVWAVSAGSNNADEGFSISTSLSGSVVLTGHFAGTVNFDPGSGTTNLDSLTSTSAFVWKLTPVGPGIDKVFIHGVLRDAGGEPISCAALRVENRSLGFESASVVFTDPNGEYAITDLAVGSTGTMNALFDLTVFASGLTFPDEVLSLATDDFNADTGEAIANITLVESSSDPATSVFGVLNDEESGALLAGVRVEALLNGEPFDPQRIAYTCADGRFEIQDLPDGKVSSEVMLTFDAPDYESQLLAPPAPGLELEVGMLKSSFFPNIVSGLVTRVIDDQPLEGAFVTVQLSLGTLGFSLETQLDGFYLVAVPADGLYKVVASASDLDTERGEGTVGPGMTTATVSLALPEEGASPPNNGGCSASPHGVSHCELGDVVTLFLVSLSFLLRRRRAETST